MSHNVISYDAKGYYWIIVSILGQWLRMSKLYMS